jgi:hypothetical protein
MLMRGLKLAILSWEKLTSTRMIAMPREGLELRVWQAGMILVMHIAGRIETSLSHGALGDA